MEKEREVDQRTHGAEVLSQSCRPQIQHGESGKRKAQDRTRWKETVIALCPPWDEVE
jgi:hypothetical protein